MTASFKVIPEELAKYEHVNGKPSWSTRELIKYEQSLIKAPDLDFVKSNPFPVKARHFGPGALYFWKHDAWEAEKAKRHIN